MKASVSDGIFAASYPENGIHRVAYTLTLRDGRAVDRDELGNLVGTKLTADVQVRKPTGVPRSLRKAVRACRSAQALPVGDTSGYHAGTPWVMRPGRHRDPIVFFLTDNGRQAWCIDGASGWGPMVSVPAGSVTWIGGGSDNNFGLVGRDVRAVTVHFPDGREVRAKVRDSIFSYPERNNSGRRSWFSVTRKDGSVIRVKG